VLDKFQPTPQAESGRLPRTRHLPPALQNPVATAGCYRPSPAVAMR
jgi:hypothetical protein